MYAHRRQPQKWLLQILASADDVQIVVVEIVRVIRVWHERRRYSNCLLRFWNV